MKTGILNYIYIFFITGIVLFSCAGPKAKFIAGDYVKPHSIAVLPVINQTVDVKGAMVFRKIFYAEIKEKKYTTILDMNIVDSLLNEEGITDGGQLSTITNTELAELLHTDGLVYIELLICGIRSFDTDAVERVKANFKLYIYPEKLIWEDEREEKKQSSQSSSSGNICTDLITQFLIEIVAKPAVRVVGMALFEHECKQEMEKLIRKSLKTLP